MLPGESDERPLPSGLVWFCDQIVAFEDPVCGAAAYLNVFLLVEVCGDGFMAPSFPLSDLDYSTDRCLGQAMDGVGSPGRVD